MEGKETRFGSGASALFATSTTGTSTGAVDSFHDSFTCLGGGLLIFNMGFGEVAPGGTGSGLYGILVLAIVTVFVAGLMVGRTPEYLRKKITAREIKLVSLYILTMPVLVLAGTGLAMALPEPKESILNPGAHGLSEVLYAFMSAANNNGSAFAGSRANTGFYNTALGLAMLAGRFLPIVLVLALAGSLAAAAAGPGDRGHAAHPPAALRRDARRRRHHRRRPDVLPGAGPRPAGGGPLMSTTTPTHRRLPPDRAAARDRQVERAGSGGLLDPKMLLTSLPDAVRKLDPRVMVHNPVMFVVEVGAVLSTVLAVTDPSLFAWSIVVWLWLTVVFANLAEAVAEGRGKAQAATLRTAKTETDRPAARERTAPRRPCPATELHRRRPGRGRGGRDHPGRRRRRRGRRQRRRVRDHRRVGAGHPGVRRRPQLGHRRHQGALGPHRRRRSRRSRARASSTG